jgi:hypothetical protein
VILRPSLPRTKTTVTSFAEAWREYPDTLVPDVKLYRFGQGPFKEDASKIKQSRLLKKPG